eukprot:m.537081 g.537081  ORF g.537081 m.537081 type:complete len:169 (-) comp22073_c0_seq5:544-1050(-)
MGNTPFRPSIPFDHAPFDHAPYDHAPYDHTLSAALPLYVVLIVRTCVLIKVVPDLPFCTVSYGPLAFALPLETTRPAPLPFNFAVDCNASTMVIDTHASAMASPWDWPLNAPVTVRVRAIPFAWNSTWVLPTHALSTSNATGPAQWLTLIPYGNAKEFHVSMFPLWKP